MKYREIEEGGVYEGTIRVRGVKTTARRRVTELLPLKSGSSFRKLRWERAEPAVGNRLHGECDVIGFATWARRRVYDNGFVETAAKPEPHRLEHAARMMADSISASAVDGDESALNYVRALVVDEDDYGSDGPTFETIRTTVLRQAGLDPDAACPCGKPHD